jgi:hypothetical protein
MNSPLALAAYELLTLMVISATLGFIIGVAAGAFAEKGKK